MQVVLRAVNRWTVLAAILLGTVFAINIRVEQITSARGNAPIFAAASVQAAATHTSRRKLPQR